MGTGFNATCYTNKESQEELQRMMEYTASIFDEIILDDWYFTECQCEQCITARGNKNWIEYYGDLMCEMSTERVIKPAHAVNPKAKVIIKYPQWYDEFHKRGYEITRQPALFDGLWAGTESRDYVYGKSSDYEIGYNAYFNMRWVQTFGDVGGGWFDASRASCETFVEQARHTVLGGGKEITLWCYGRMLKEKHGDDPVFGYPVASMKALSKEYSGLVKLACFVQNKPVKGIQLLKPGNSEPYEETWFCSFVGNLGLPFIPASEFDENALAAVYSVHVLKNPGFSEKLQHMIKKGTPVVITDGLAKRIENQDLLKNENLSVIKIKGDAKRLLQLTREEINPIRDKLLAPFGMKFDAPNKVEFYLFGDNHFIVENFNDEAVDVTLELPQVRNIQKSLILPEKEEIALSQAGNTIRMHIPPRTLIAAEYK